MKEKTMKKTQNPCVANYRKTKRERALTSIDVAINQTNNECDYHGTCGRIWMAHDLDLITTDEAVRLVGRAARHSHEASDELAEKEFNGVIYSMYGESAPCDWNDPATYEAFDIE